MQGDNARTIDDQVVPDEEAKLLLAYYMEGTISKCRATFYKGLR